MSDADPLDLSGQLFDARYRMAEKVGEGGMAYVYLAVDTESSAKVAIKILLPGLVNDPVSMERLRREANLGARLIHPNLCHILRIGHVGAFEYIVMPFIDGEALCERTWRDGPLPVETAARFVADMCAGLHFAHGHGVVHRDLKPENIMIAREDDGIGRAIVMDFGLAIARKLGDGSARLTRTGLVVGTPEFMSPEHMRGKPVDARSDVYSLAFMMYESMTGQLPFDGESLRDLMVARLKGDAVPIRARRPDLGFTEPLERVFAKALAIRAEDRYPSMPDLAQAFARATTPRRDAAAGGLLRWFRR